MKTSVLKTILFTGISLSGVLGVQAQNFLNGSFETTTAPFACNYNMSDATFNTRMSNTNAYGGGNELDILINGCYTAGIPDGVRCVGVAHWPTRDEFAMALTAPLVAGNSYTIDFYSYSEVTFRPQGNLELGASTTNNAFGTLIYTAATVPSTWSNHVFTFVAPNNATNITVRNIAGAIHWNHVDFFAFTPPLPVQLLNFDATATNNNEVKLDWSTSSEINNDYFTIERSTNNIIWEEIEDINGAGNSKTTLHYETFDSEPFSGTSYYRLKQTDFNGAFKYSDIVAVNLDDEGLSPIHIYPNPAINILNIEADASELSDVKIFNMIGQDVSALTQFKHLNNSKIQIDLSTLAAGVYTIKSTTRNSKFCKK